MDKGHIDQIGSPKQLCLAPKTRFTAQFVGTKQHHRRKVQEVAGDIATVECSAGRFHAMLSNETVTRGRGLRRRSTVTLVIQAAKVRRPAERRAATRTT